MINLTNKLDDLRDEARTKDENLNQAQDQISEANQRAETSRNEIQNLQGRCNSKFWKQYYKLNRMKNNTQKYE